MFATKCTTEIYSTVNLIILTLHYVNIFYNFT